MGLKKFNICSRREAKDGEKAYWPKVGIIFFDEEKNQGSLKLDMFPEMTWFMFPYERRDSSVNEKPDW